MIANEFANFKLATWYNALMELNTNRRIETSLPIHIYIRPIEKPELEWVPFETGPGFFDIPQGFCANVAIQGIDNAILKTMVEEICEVNDIVCLNLSENRKIDNDGIRYLSQMQLISELNLSACGLNNHGMDILVKMKNIRKLDLSYCTRLTDPGILKIKEMRRLEELYLRGIPRITHATIKWIERRDLLIRR
ncbi:MAG: hypothetical protein CVU46_06700 [Chloroflexi bacterium HGW-Chloroflexi-8]|nr:MAG: hypothetical protein CVU46_06700 [Chloroflexi bacterium HGW-Chloroflexi-8]